MNLAKLGLYLGLRVQQLSLYIQIAWINVLLVFARLERMFLSK
jgi:hypothetical protein